MVSSVFFACQNCGNTKKFRIFRSTFQIVEQSSELGICVNKSSILPNLRQNDNYVECLLCQKKSEFENAADIGKKYIKESKKQFSKKDCNLS